MRKSRFSEEQIIGMLKEQQAGMPVADLCRKHGISDATFYTWRTKYGGMEVSDARKLKALEEENRKLKKLLAESMLDVATLREAPRKKLLTPRSRRMVVTWAIDEKGYSQRRACRLIGIEPKTYRYASSRGDDAAVRAAAAGIWRRERRRFGYRRLHILLRREGIVLNHKKLFRLYREERLTVRRRGGRKRALGTRAPMALPQGPNQRWSLDFVSDVLVDGRRFRVLVIVDDFTRECLALVVDTSLSGRRVARELDRHRRGARQAADDRQRQRHRADLARDPALAGGTRRRVALHRARQADAEWLRRKPQRPLPRRMPQRACVPGSCRWHAGSSKRGGSTTTPTGPIPASAASPRTSLQPGPKQDHNQNGFWL